MFLAAAPRVGDFIYLPIEGEDYPKRYRVWEVEFYGEHAVGEDTVPAGINLIVESEADFIARES
jgi:hypothetical protein